MATSTAKEAARSSPRDASIPATEITLGLTPSMAVTLDNLTARIDAPIEEVLTQAVALLLVAVEARNRGQRLCLANEDLKITGEIVDFGIAGDHVGIDPFPEAESDQLDP